MEFSRSKRGQGGQGEKQKKTIKDEKQAGSSLVPGTLTSLSTELKDRSNPHFIHMGK